MMRSCGLNIVVVGALLMILLAADAWRVMPSTRVLHHNVQHQALSVIPPRTAAIGFSRIGLMHRCVLKASNTEIDDDGDVEWTEDEALQYLKQEFVLLSGKKPTISFKQFMKWEEIQAMIQDEIIEAEDCEMIWKRHSSGLDNEIDMPTFIRINQDLDDLLDDDDDEEGDGYDEDEHDKDGEETKGMVVQKEDTDHEDCGDECESFEVADDSFAELNAWAASTVPTEFFDKDYLKHIRKFFMSNTQEVSEEYVPMWIQASKEKLSAKQEETFRRVLTFQKFLHWEDVESFEKDGNLDITAIEAAWQEALTFQTENNIVVPGVHEEVITWETFLRLMLRLDEMMEDVQAALESISDEDITTYYRESFAELTHNRTVLFWNEFQNWEEVRYFVEEKILSEEKIKELWDALPKESYVTATLDEEGINFDSFLALNEAVEDLLASQEIEEGDDAEYDDDNDDEDEGDEDEE